MCNKIFFQNLKQAKCVKYTHIILCVFLFIGGSFVIGSLFAQSDSQTLAEPESTERPIQASQPVSTSEELDRSVRSILQDSISTIQNAQNYSVDLYSHVDILGKVFTGKGQYLQRRQMNETKHRETYSMRWEMDYEISNFKLHQLSILNGDLDRLWTLTERVVNPDMQQEQNAGNSETVKIVNLQDVQEKVAKSPEKYVGLESPWFSQPNVAQILIGILDSCDFTMAGERQIANRATYECEGQLKPELVSKILESRGLPLSAGLAGLPREVPMKVKILIDKELHLPLLIHFFRTHPDSEEVLPKDERFDYTIQFEQSLLNNMKPAEDFFGIDPAIETIDQTELFLEQHQVKN